MVNLIRKISNHPVNEENIYIVSFAMYFVISFFLTSTYTDYISSHFFHEVSYIPLLLVLFKVIIIDFKDKTQWILSILILILLVISWRNSGEFIFFPMGIFMLGAYKVSFKKIIYIYFLIGTILLTFSFFTSLIGLTKNLIFYRGITSVTRQSFGIIYPTDFAAHILFLVLAYCYLYFEKISWKSYLIFALISYFIVKFCDARLNATAILCLIPVILIAKLAKKGNKTARIATIFYWCFPILFSYIILVLSYLYRPSIKILDKINNLLSGRLYFGHYALIKYPINFFGQQVVENGFGGNAGHKLAKEGAMHYFYIDSSFLRLLIIYGVIMFILVILSMTIISWISIERKDYVLASILLIITISSIFEQRLIDIAYNPFLLALFAKCYNQKNQIGEKL